MCWQILVKLPNIIFHKNKISGSQVLTCEQTDTVKLIRMFQKSLAVNKPKINELGSKVATENTNLTKVLKKIIHELSEYVQSSKMFPR